MTSNRFGLNRSLGAGVTAIAVVAVLGSGSALAAFHQLQAATAMRYHSHLTIVALQDFEAAMLNQETGVRGYLLTGRPASLEPYHWGHPAMQQAIAALDGLTAANTAEARLLGEAEQAARHWQATIADPVAATLADPALLAQARTLESNGDGKRAFDSFRAKLGALMQVENEAFSGQDVVVRRANRLATLALWLSAAFTLLICVGVGIAINRLITRPLVALAAVMRRLVQRDTDLAVPSVLQRNEVGDMARAVEVFRDSLIELDRTSVLRVTADTLPALVGYIAADHKVAFLNGEFARWFDLGSADVANASGRPVEQLFPRGTFPGAATELGRALNGEEVRFAQQLTPIGSAAPRDMEAYYRPHTNPAGQVLGAVTLLTDVTDRKGIDRRLRHQARDLQRSNDELEQFAYVASHDLKAPLRGIENLASWIEEDLAEALTGETRANMVLLKSRVRRLESLLDDLLAYSRAGRADTVVRMVDSHALVADLAALISPPDGFAIVPDPALPTLRAAQAALSQVLQNLIGNAVKHHPAPATGHVWVSAARDGPFHAFQVADDGAGIPERYRDRVFGMFQTLRPRDEVEGSGMGLAIVKKLIERQSGKVWLAEREGGGLVVHFTWPVEPVSQAAEQARPGTI